MQQNKHILILFWLIGGIIACGSPPETQLTMRDAQVAIDVTTTSSDMGVNDSGNELDEDMAIADAAQPLDMNAPQDAQTPIAETGRIECGALTYSSLSLRTGDLEDGWLYTGVTERASGYSGSCGGLGSEALIKFTAPESGIYTLLLTTSTGSSPILYVRETCEEADTETACAEGLAQLGGATISVEAAAGSVSYVFVDTWQPSLPVEFALEIYYAVDHQAPRIEYASLSIDSGDLRFKIRADDVNANVVSGVLESTDPDVTAIYPFTFDSRMSEGTLRYADLNFGDISIAPSGWQVTVTDQTGLNSDATMVTEYTTQNGELESDCGMSTQQMVDCIEGSVCSEGPNEPSVCTESLPPEILEFNVFKTSLGHTARAQATDANLDIAFGLIELMDSQGNRLERHLVPIEQDEQLTGLLVDLPQQVSELASLANLTLTDEAGYETTVSDITIETPGTLARGLTCTPSALEQRCAPEDICLRGCETDRAECAAACIIRIAPTVKSASLIKNTPRNRLTLTLEIEDPQRIFTDVLVHPTDGAEAPIDFAFNGWRRISDSVYSSEASIYLTDDFRTLTALVVTPMDKDGLMGQPFQIDVQNPIEVQPDDPCDPLDAKTLCTEGHACFANEDGRFICALSNSPSIDEATLYTNPDLTYAGVRAFGSTGDANARAILIRTIARNTQPSQLISVPIETPIPSQSTVDIAQRLASVPENVELEMAIQDERYLQSEWQPMSRVIAGSIDNDESCQLDIIFGQCAENMDCLPSERGGLTCQTVASTCPEEWQVESIREVSESTTFRGDTRDGYTSHTGSCNFGGQAIIHGFTPDADRLYVARASSMSPTPIRYPRLAIFETCGQPQTELSCSQNSRVAFEGQTGITAYIAISAPPLGPDFPGTYALEVAPHRAARIRTISLIEPFVLDMLDLNIEIEIGTETVTSISIRVLDALGSPLWSPVYGESWTQSLAPTESDETFTAVSTLDLSSFDPALIHTVELSLIDSLNVYSETQSVLIP